LLFFASTAHETASIYDGVAGNLVRICGFKANGMTVEVPTG
jgi:hypothetical protein